MAKKKKGNVELVALKCEECGRRNYTTQKNRKNITVKLEFSKSTVSKTVDEGSIPS